MLDFLEELRRKPEDARKKIVFAATYGFHCPYYFYLLACRVRFGK